MEKKEILCFLLDEAKLALETDDEVGFKKVSDCLVFFDEYKELCDNLHEVYNAKNYGLIIDLKNYMCVVDTLAKLGFPNAEQLSDIVNDSINYFKELD